MAAVNILSFKGYRLVGRLCRNCGVMMMTTNRWSRPNGASLLLQQSHQLRRDFHHLRVETLSETWQTLKKNLTLKRKAKANMVPVSTNFVPGSEMGIALFLIDMNAKVHFSNGRWYGKLENGMAWLDEKAVGSNVNAVDARGALLDRNGIKDVVNLKDLKFLNLEGCPYIDDACLASLVHLRDSLTHLNINKCPSVTPKGVATLHKLRKLQHLNMRDLPAVKHPKLIAAFLEEALPNLRVNIISHAAEKERKKKGHVDEEFPQAQQSSA